VQLREATRVSIDAPHTQYIEAVLGERTRLVETYDVDLAPDVDSIRRDAENSLFAEALDGKGGTDGECRGKSRGDDDSDEVECAEHDGLPFDLGMISEVWTSRVRMKPSLTPMRTN
jgi:hypothetical protein